jgi:hypothetical protein
MASVKARHANLSSACWKTVESLHHTTVDLGSLQGHTGPCTLSLLGHRLWPLWALSSLHPDVPASLHYLCSFTLYCMPMTSLPFSSVLWSPHPYNLCPIFSLTSILSFRAWALISPKPPNWGPSFPLLPLLPHPPLHAYDSPDFFLLYFSSLVQHP